MARKTIPVADLVNKVNGMIAYSAEHHPDTAVQNRYALCTLIESVLHDTDNYRGFRFLAAPNDVIADKYDDSARKYYCKGIPVVF
jgi:hypothetical protein